MIILLASRDFGRGLDCMNTISHVPNSLRSAGRELRLSLANPLDQLPRDQFVRAWSAVVYLFPSLHPDGYDDAESGWPPVLKRFAAEAWRRADAGEQADEEWRHGNRTPHPNPLPGRGGEGEAQWSGLYDRMHTNEPDEIERRLELAVEYGDGFTE